MANYDVIGSIVILKFNEDTKKSEKIKIAKEILKRSNIKTAVEKLDKIKGRLRTIQTKHLAGEKNLESIYKENGCIFKLNVENCYFSPRLSNERKEVSTKIKKKDNVLVMFSGVGPYSIVVAKKSKPKSITTIELGRDCNKYAIENARLNKVENINIIQGDVKKIIDITDKSKNEKKFGLKFFDVILMPRPNLKDHFLRQAFAVSKTGTKIFYYGFAREDEKDNMIKEIKEESIKARKKIRILQVKEAGDIAPYKHRYRVDIRVVK